MTSPSSTVAWLDETLRRNLKEAQDHFNVTKTQTEIFTATDWAGGQEHLWCYVVQHRVAKAEGGWEPWESDTKPAHFRTEDGAKERMASRIADLCKDAEFAALIEFRVVPKWLGYIPDGDEAWIQP